MVSDLSRAILFIIKRGASTAAEVVDLLGGSYDDQLVRRRIASLKYNKFINTGSDSDIKITDKGLAALNNIEFEQIVDNKPWDKQWRLVIYDIPESKRLARNKIRQLLKDLGFRQLQISVWAHPLPCLKQFKIIRDAYGIENHLLLLEINDSDTFAGLKKQFSKQYPQVSNH